MLYESINILALPPLLLIIHLWLLLCTEYWDYGPSVWTNMSILTFLKACPYEKGLVFSGHRWENAHQQYPGFIDKFCTCICEGEEAFPNFHSRKGIFYSNGFRVLVKLLLSFKYFKHMIGSAWMDGVSSVAEPTDTVLGTHYSDIEMRVSKFSLRMKHWHEIL